MAAETFTFVEFGSAATRIGGVCGSERFICTQTRLASPPAYDAVVIIGLFAALCGLADVELGCSWGWATAPDGKVRHQRAPESITLRVIAVPGCTARS
jgi:hypothetical protein